MRGRALAALGQREEAEAVLINAAMAAESFRQADVILGQMRQALGTDGTHALLEEQLSQWNPLWRQLVLAQLDLQRDEPHEALRRLQGMQLPAGSDNQVRRVHGRSIALSHYKSGSYDDAEKAYRQLLEIFPEDLATMNDLAWLLVRDMQQPRQAREVARQAARLAPDLPEVLDTLGYIELQLGVLEEARQTLERSVTIRASGPNHLYLAMVEQKAGNMMLADQLIQRAISMLDSQRDQELLEQARSLATQWRDAN